MADRLRYITWIALGALCGVLLPGPPALAAPGDSDPDFGTAGDVATPIPGTTQSVASALVRLPDGRLLSAGSATFGGTNEVVLVRYLVDGSPDPGFGTGGVRRPLPGVAVAPGEVALARHGDGRLVVAATLLAGGEQDVLVARLSALGVLDAGFGAGGVRVLDVEDDDRVAAVAVDPTGRPVVAGSAGEQVLVARLTSLGDPDSSFGDQGIVRTDASGAGLASAAHDLALQPGGEVVVAGEASNGDDLDLAVLRYDEHGVPDAGFGSGGVVTTPVGVAVPFGPPADDSARAVLVEPSGHVVVAGATRSNVHGVVVARYDASGTLDPAFGGGGVVVAAEIAEGGQGFALVREPNGRLVVAGRVLSSEAIAVHATLLVRLEPDGALDTSFGDQGLVVHDQSGSLFPHDAANAVVRDSLGRFVVAGFTDPTFSPWTATSIALSRFLGDGPCASGPDAGCIGTRAPRREILRLRDPLAGTPRLAWRLPNLPATEVADFGDPLDGEGYELCVFDESGERVAWAAVEAGATCGSRPCWRRVGKGFDYRDGDRAAGGLARIQLRAGGDGKARILVDAAGDQLDLPPLPLAPPITVQLHATSDVCWEGVYGADGVRRNDGTSFLARGGQS